MQFELSTSHHDASVLAAALRVLDPDVQVALDAGRGRLEVLASATRVQIQDVLQSVGCVAQPLESEVHISGGSTCCGGCG